MTSCKKIIKTMNESSLELYWLIKKKPTNRKKIFQAIHDKNPNELMNIIPMISDQTKKKLKNNYQKEKCLDEVIMNYDYFPHLKEIRNIINIDLIIEEIISNQNYQKKLNLYYTDLILDELIFHFYDYEELKLLSDLKQEVMLMNEETNQKIITHIKKFYIKRITI